MDNNENEFSPDDSLQLIRSMIDSAKLSISDNSHYYLLWGYSIMVACILQYVFAAVINYPHPYYAWIATPVALVIHCIFLIRDKHVKRVKTFVNEATSYVGTVLLLSSFTFPFVFSKIGWQHCYPFYILLFSIGTYITGSLMKFVPLRTGGLACMVLVAITPYFSYNLQILIMAFAILISYIIPGHLLQRQYKKSL